METYFSFLRSWSLAPNLVSLLPDPELGEESILPLAPESHVN